MSCLALNIHPARALVPPPRLRAKRAGISAPLRSCLAGLAIELLGRIGALGLLRIPAPTRCFDGAVLILKRFFAGLWGGLEKGVTSVTVGDG